MLIMRGLIGLIVLALWIYCIFDVITTDESLMRNLPKFLWLGIVIFVPTIGSIVWLVAGRPERATFRIGDTSYRPNPVGIEDRPEFSLRMREEQLRRREEALRRREREAGLVRDDDPPPDPPPPAG